jgi:hypothetical protein
MTRCFGPGIILSVLLVAVAPPAHGQMTSQQAILQMTRGFNLGRCFEIPDDANPTTYGHAMTQQDFINIKNAGFNFVRLPIRWDNYTSTASPYTVSSNYLNTIQQCVDWALGRGLIIIINSHHDEWIDRDSSGDLERFKAIWTQVSARFKNHSDRLLFEIMNEPALSVSRVNTIDNAIFPIIRSTNPTRIILFGGPGQSKDRLGACTYPAGDQYLMGEIHNYEPWTFAGEGTGTWGTTDDYDNMEAIFAWAVNWTVTNGIPVVLGEWGTRTICESVSREKYVKAMVGFASAKGIAPCVWSDFGWFSIYNGSTFTAVKDWIMAVTQPAPAPANAAPTLNALGNLTVNENAGLQTVNLSGISSGASNEVQTLTVTAVSSNPSLIPTPAVTYTSPNTTGTLAFTPVSHASGAATITVTVNDGGVSNNIVTRAFTVTVNAATNPPIVITGINAQTNTVGLTWTSNTGRLYAVEYSLTLLTWSNVVTGISAATGTNKTSVILDLTGGGTSTNGVLVQYQMGQFGPQIQDATNTLAGGNLTNGSGLNLFNPNSTIAYTSSPSLAITFSIASTNLSAALANQAWFTFALTVGSSVADLDLTSLTLNAARGGTGTPRGYAIFVTTPTTTDQQVQGATELTTQRFDWGPLQKIDLSSVASLQNLTASQAVTFKIPVYSPTTSSSLDFDSITLNGKVSSGGTPLPPGAKEVFFRVRQ